MKEWMLIKVKAYHIYVLKMSISQDMVTKGFGKTKEKPEVLNMVPHSLRVFKIHNQKAGGG